MIKAVVNGQLKTEITVDDRGLQFGDGLFETLAVHDGKPLLWSQHLDRLRAGCRQLKITIPATERFEEDVHSVCPATGKSVLKLIITRGQSQRGYQIDPEAVTTRIAISSPWPYDDQRLFDDGIAASICQTRLSQQPQLAKIKHLNRLEQIILRQEIKAGCNEAIVMNNRHHVIEGVMSNLFIVKQQQLITPDLSQSGVAGIMRAEVLKQAVKLNWQVQQKNIFLQDVIDADEIFFTNSLIGIWPVNRIQQHIYPIGELSQQLQHEISYAHCYV